MIPCTQVNIEINTHCNYRCRFCPQRDAPKPVRVMPLSDFQLVLVALSELLPGDPEWVALNHYGEPALDPGLLDKARALADQGWWLRLFTNASSLNIDIAMALREMNHLDAFIINLPSLDPETYKVQTGHSIDRFLKNVDALIANKLPFAFCINEDSDPVVPELMKRWGSEAAYFCNLTNSRAGLVSGQWIVRVKDKWTHPALPGCPFFDKQLNVAVDGSLFMCCQDYHQKCTFGNLLQDETKDIVIARQGLHDVIFGKQPAPADMICRECVRLGGGGEGE